MVEELLVGYQYGTLHITKDELIKILFDKCNGDEGESISIIAQLEEENDEAHKENIKLRQHVRELEQTLENIRRLL